MGRGVKGRRSRHKAANIPTVLLRDNFAAMAPRRGLALGARRTASEPSIAGCLAAGLRDQSPTGRRFQRPPAVSSPTTAPVGQARQLSQPSALHIDAAGRCRSDGGARYTKSRRLLTL